MNIFSKSNIIKLDSVDSTNNYAKTLINESNRNPFVVVANEQVNGRGQQGNSWHAVKGENLLFSMLLHPINLKAEKQFILNKVISLAVKRFIEKTINSKVLIKWPNDIYVDNKKIAGILIEHSIMDDMLYNSIIGIGINVNQNQFPDDIPNPISMKLITGKEYDLNDCLNDFLCIFNECYLKLNLHDLECLNNSYLESLYLFKVKSNFIYKDIYITATIKNVDAYGRLVLIDEENKVITCNLKEIKFVL